MIVDLITVLVIDTTSGIADSCVLPQLPEDCLRQISLRSASPEGVSRQDADIILVSLTAFDDLELLSRISGEAVAPIVALLDTDDDTLMQAAFAAGAEECLVCGQDTTRLPATLRRIHTRWQARHAGTSSAALAHHNQVLLESLERSAVEYRHAVRTLNVLSECNQTLIRATNERALLDEMCRIIVELGGYRMAWIAYADADRLLPITPMAIAGYDAEYLQTISSTFVNDPQHCCPAMQVIHSGTPCIIRDIEAIPHLTPWRDAALARGYASVISLPLQADDAILGALTIYSGKVDAFDTPEQALLTELASDLSFGITTLRMRDQRQQVQEALRIERDQLHRYLDVAEVMLMVLDRNGIVTQINRKGCEILGLSEEEINGKEWFGTFLPPGEGNDVQSVFARFIAGEGELPSSFENRVLYRDGSSRIIAWHNAAMYDDDGQLSGVVCSGEDITARRSAEDALAMSEVLYRSLFEQMEEGFALYELLYDSQNTPVDYRILDVNPAYERIMEMPNAQVVGQLASTVFSFNNALPIEIFAAVAETGKPAQFRTYLPEIDKYLRVSVFSPRKGQFATFFADITAHRKAEAEVQQGIVRLRKALEGTVSALATTTERRDPYTAGHQQRVAKLACAIGRVMNLSNDDIEQLRIAALLHDIGKIAVPIEILTKPGRITDPEFSIIKDHAQIGHDILQAIDFPWPIASVVLQHHCRLDGTGYPSGLQQQDISPMARILCVADVVEAMSSHRPYRPALGIQAALCEVTHHAGTAFDPEVVRACLHVFQEENFQFD